jgi:hypothetical protein
MYILSDQKSFETLACFLLNPGCNLCIIVILLGNMEEEIDIVY